MPAYPRHHWGAVFSEAQYQLLKKYADSRELERPNDILHALIRDAFSTQGIEFPDDVPKHGGKREGAGRKQAKGDET